MPTAISLSDRVEIELLTADEFLDWLKPEVHADLIDGKKTMHTPVSLRHADLVNFLHTLLTLFAEAKGIGEVHREVVAVRLSSRNVFLPDLAFFSSEQVPRMKETHVPFAPVWVCETLSSNTADRDVGPKFAAYEEHGVQEYWILDLETLAHRFYAREGEVLVEFAKGDSRIRSKAIPGFWVERSWLNPGKLLPVAPCAEQLLSA